MFGNSLAGTAAIGATAVMLNTGIQAAWSLLAGVTLFMAGLVVKNIIPKKEF
jgi:hypothetical protein